ncbi:hypothetical protein VTK73DRAFT_8856 [Phialemonium thermophilum]|uniref:DUF7708 domain-containing protein n=1 Tax=Phialemonium thermophilum TaxID=223376 RepID=A0ABR3W5X3_9PEZI
MAAEEKEKDLWREALDTLSEEDRRWIEESRVQEDRLQILKHVHESAELQRRQCIDKGRSITTRSGREIKFRHILEKISGYVSELIKVVDVGVAFDGSGHAATPWGVIKFILQGASSNVELFTKLGDGVVLVSNLIARYAVIEQLYLREDLEMKPDLTKHMIALYASILSYLASAKRYFERNSAGKFQDCIN